MKTLFLTIVSLSLMLLMSFGVYADTESFFRDLRHGDEGDDVRALQVFLNNNTQTRVAIEGAGSPGNETNFFGARTASAVSRFQELYKNEILKPAGLNFGTGYFGPLTRKHALKLHSSFSSPQSAEIANAPVANGQYNSQTETSERSLLESFINLGRPNIFSLSRYEAGRGQIVTIYGENFSNKYNTLKIGESTSLSDLKSDSGKSLEFTVPLDVPTGSYNLWIENEGGSSFNPQYGEYFSIADSPNDPPEVISVSPPFLSVRNSSQSAITVKGKNFSREGNSIYSPLGFIKGVPSSDGQTIVFFIDTFPSWPEIEGIAKSASGSFFPLMIGVQNKYGFSTGKIFINIIF